jgi:hypothetical protein
MAFCRQHGFYPTPRRFDVDAVPDGLRYLIPYAEIWGQDFDEDRRAVIAATPKAVRKHVAELMNADSVQNKLGDWLAGPEAALEQQSEAYYSYLGMAADIMAD